jgi:hypothetical protein
MMPRVTNNPIRAKIMRLGIKGKIGNLGEK